MRYLATGLVALAMIACRTQTTDLCLPECGDDDQAFFAQCVASGYVDADVECLAGNRACCAREAYCIGELDDQLVVQTSPACELEECFRPCDGSDDLYYQECMAMGSEVCGEGEPYCCALEAACLGSLGDIEVSAPGCCSDPFDCASDEFCNPSTWTCEPNSGGFCGDSIAQPDEECDDGPSPSPDCPYGVESCLVCTDTCRETEGHTSFCGDGLVDPNEEECEPVIDSTCRADCTYGGGDTCANGVQDGLETDIDCGGGVCRACSPGQECRTASDCAPLSPLCGSTIDCYPGDGGCVELDFLCRSADPCMAALCTTTGCGLEPMDADGDGYPAMMDSAGRTCRGGTDCDDGNYDVNPGIAFDLGCSPTEIGYDFDDDCDSYIDEDC